MNVCFRLELRTFNIKVSIVQPGLFKTNVSDTKKWMEITEERYKNLDDQLKIQYPNYFCDYSKILLIVNKFSSIKNYKRFFFNYS